MKPTVVEALRKMRFLDKMLFLLQDSHNQQNNRMYAARYFDVPKDKNDSSTAPKCEKIVIWGSITKTGKLPHLLIDQGVEIDTNSAS